MPKGTNELLTQFINPELCWRDPVLDHIFTFYLSGRHSDFRGTVTQFSLAQGLCKFPDWLGRSWALHRGLLCFFAGRSRSRLSRLPCLSSLPHWCLFFPKCMSRAPAASTGTPTTVFSLLCRSKGCLRPGKLMQGRVPFPLPSPPPLPCSERMLPKDGGALCSHWARSPCRLWFGELILFLICLLKMWTADFPKQQKHRKKKSRVV